jgi:hypothetical protein
MPMQQQRAQVEKFLAGPPDRRKPFSHQQLQDQLGIASVMFLLAGFRGADLRSISNLAGNPALYGTLLYLQYACANYRQCCQ